MGPGVQRPYLEKSSGYKVFFPLFHVKKISFNMRILGSKTLLGKILRLEVAFVLACKLEKNKLISDELHVLKSVICWKSGQ